MLQGPRSAQGTPSAQGTQAHDFHWTLRSRFGAKNCWRRERADAWHKCQSRLEERLLANARINTNKQVYNTLVGYVHTQCLPSDKAARDAFSRHLGRRATLSEFRALDEDELVAPGALVVICVMPKHAIEPPRERLVAKAPPANLGEMERIEYMLAHPARPIKERVGPKPTNPHYVCRNCTRRGHYTNHCPWKGGGLAMTRTEREAQAPTQYPTGIPKARLRRVEAECDEAQNNAQMDMRARTLVDKESGATYSHDFSDATRWEAYVRHRRLNERPTRMLKRKRD